MLWFHQLRICQFPRFHYSFQCPGCCLRNTHYPSASKRAAPFPAVPRSFRAIVAPKSHIVPSGAPTPVPAGVPSRLVGCARRVLTLEKRAYRLRSVFRKMKETRRQTLTCAAAARNPSTLTRGSLPFGCYLCCISDGEYTCGRWVDTGATSLISEVQKCFRTSKPSGQQLEYKIRAVWTNTSSAPDLLRSDTSSNP